MEGLNVVDALKLWQHCLPRALPYQAHF
jgi:hypothetical protein